MDRRSFLAMGMAAGAAAISKTGDAKAATRTAGRDKFKLKYAPGLNAFNEHAGKDPIDNIKFILRNKRCK